MHLLISINQLINDKNLNSNEIRLFIYSMEMTMKLKEKTNFHNFIAAAVAPGKSPNHNLGIYHKKLPTLFVHR